jgi:hypothetical protein
MRPALESKLSQNVWNLQSPTYAIYIDVKNVSVTKQHRLGQAALELGATPQLMFSTTGLCFFSLCGLMPSQNGWSFRIWAPAPTIREESAEESVKNP